VEGATGADFEVYASNDVDAVVTMTATIEGSQLMFSPLPL
jgi:hypothetical protein